MKKLTDQPTVLLTLTLPTTKHGFYLLCRSLRGHISKACETGIIRGAVRVQLSDKFARILDKTADSLGFNLEMGRKMGEMIEIAMGIMLGVPMDPQNFDHSLERKGIRIEEWGGIGGPSLYVDIKAELPIHLNG